MAPSANYYLSVDIDDSSEASPDDSSQCIEMSDTSLSLTFFDLRTQLRAPPSSSMSQIEILTNAVQDHLHLCSKADLIVFRWPWIAGPCEESHEQQIDKWLQHLRDEEGEPVIPQHIGVGVIQHCIARDPILCWGPGKSAPFDDVIPQIRAVEIEAMLRRKNVIWEPKDYHYSLPSGEHTDVFIRVADAIQKPHDAYVMACWMSDRISNNCGVIVDTGGLTPLLLQLEILLNRYGLKIGQTAIISAYPTGRSTVRKTVEAARDDFTEDIIGILSVNSTGTLQNTLLDELERVKKSDNIEFSLDVIVNRVPAFSDQSSYGHTDNDNLRSWVNIKRPNDPDFGGSCQLCHSPEKAPVVAIDPRTYATLCLPKPHLVMPDTKYAVAGQDFWQRASKCGGRAIEVNPHPKSSASHAKRTPVVVRPILELIAQPDDLTEIVKSRWHSLLKEHTENQDLCRALQSTDLVVASSQDIKNVQIPSFAGSYDVDLKDSLCMVLESVGLNRELPIVTTEDQTALQDHISRLCPDKGILIFSWGSVTGLTLRHLKLAVADALVHYSSNIQVNALVFHARTSSPSEWKAQQNQFKPNFLECLWSSCFPSDSPVRDEGRLLDLPEIQTNRSSTAAVFMQQRKQFLEMYSMYANREDDWSPRFNLPDQEAHPEHIFWGMSRDDKHQSHVRGRSIYGAELDCLTAYAAMGSVVNYTRLSAEPRAAPRWVMFDMGRIVRSYFDAIIICALLRWLQPGELWWGERDTPNSAEESVSFLLDQAENTKEQVLLVPELLLASAQGKVPKNTHTHVREWAIKTKDGWPKEKSYDMARGAVEIGLKLLDMT